MLKKLNTYRKPEFFIFFFLIFCSFFSINKLVVNPVYILGALTLIFSLFYFKFSSLNKFQFYYIIYFLISIFSFMLGVSSFYNITPDIVYLSTVLYLYCLVLGSATVQIGNILPQNQRVKVYNLSFNCLIFYMLLDFLIRIALSGGGGTFYDFKWGLFYFDSNFSALIILMFLMFSVFLKKNNIYNLGFIKFFILLFLLITTFSRAAILAFIISYVLMRYANKLIVPIALVFSIVSLLFFEMMVKSYMGGESFVNIDGSFNSKFYLISIAIDNYQNLPLLNKIFGIGLGNFVYYSNGIFAHNMLITFFYEFGYVGTILFFLFILISYNRIGKNIFYILIPFFIAGFSLFSAFMPFFFVLVSCMYLETRPPSEKSIL